MIDALLLSVTAVFFAATFALVKLCERL